MSQPPQVVVIAGPNGAGKSTGAPAILRNAFQIADFVNADVIAQGLSGYSPETTALAAGQIMLERLHELAAARRNFAFETTLASRTLAPWLSGLQASGYHFCLLYLWLPSAEMAVQRVQQRVLAGGHHVEQSTVVRRYSAGLRNFFRLYRPIADLWRMYDSSTARSPRLIAAGTQRATTTVPLLDVWNSLLAEYDDART